MVASELGFAEVASGHRVARVRGERGFEWKRRSLCWRGVASSLVCGPREVQRALGVRVGLLVRLGRLLEEGDDGRVPPISDSERRGANAGCGGPKGKLARKGLGVPSDKPRRLRATSGLWDDGPRVSHLFFQRKPSA
jgi:hypothetical protein